MTASTTAMASAASPAAPRHGIVLFGHGARDARWAEPFQRLAARLAARTAAPVELAWLELMTPDLAGALAALLARGCGAVTVVPVFFGRGAHLRRDLPLLIEQCRAAHPTLDLRCAGAVGEDDAVLDAITDFCLRQLAD